MFDVVIVGQGLAGTALAWHLRWAGRRVLVLDRATAGTSSRVAAGLMTPVTGKRLAPAWRFAEVWPVARDFYRRVEAETGERFFHERAVVRLFRDAGERDVFTAKGLGGRLDPPLREEWFFAPHGAFEADAGQLDAPRYLDASRTAFRFVEADIHPARDIEPTADGVHLPRLNVVAGRLVFCQGYAAATNPWFPAVRFNAAKGEVLTVRVPGLTEERVVNRGVWLAPAGGGEYLAGSTYDRDALDNIPTERGREEITAGLRAFLRLPFEVTGHRAAVRPAVEDQKPVLGWHPEYPQLGCFNGLGSKGASLAPFFAGQLVGGVVEPIVDVNRAGPPFVAGKLPSPEAP